MNPIPPSAIVCGQSRIPLVWWIRWRAVITAPKSGSSGDVAAHVRIEVEVAFGFEKESGHGAELLGYRRDVEDRFRRDGDGVIEVRSAVPGTMDHLPIPSDPYRRPGPVAPKVGEDRVDFRIGRTAGTGPGSGRGRAAGSEDQEAERCHGGLRDRGSPLHGFVPFPSGCGGAGSRARHDGARRGPQGSTSQDDDAEGRLQATDQRRISTSSWRANSRHVSPNHPEDYRHITRWAIAKYPCKLSPNHPRGRPLRGASEAIRLPNPIMRYLPRIVDSELSDRLQRAGAVVIEGPRACGKTSTARRLAASEALLDTDENARRMVETRTRLRLLPGAIPRLFDEWQVAPSIWNHVRRAVDDRSEPGKFILTGSAVPADDVTRHTGAGRFSRLRMRPMSLFELGISSGDNSLGELLDGNRPPAKPSALTVSSVAEVLSVGGLAWKPRCADRTEHLRTNRDYLEEIRRVDLPRVDGKARDPVRVGRLLGSLARNVATPVSVSRLASDAGGSDPRAESGHRCGPTSMLSSD